MGAQPPTALAVLHATSLHAMPDGSGVRSKTRESFGFKRAVGFRGVPGVSLVVIEISQELMCCQLAKAHYQFGMGDWACGTWNAPAHLCLIASGWSEMAGR